MEKTRGTGTTTYVGGGYEVAPGSNVTKYIYAGGELVATIGGSGATTTTSFVHRDHLSSTNVTTNQSGGVATVLDYYPYGSPRIESGTPPSRQYIGQYDDSESDLAYLNARYYDSARGQFTSQDPVFWSEKQNLLNPQSLNSYSYAEGNPIVKKDPLGLAATKAQQMKVLKSQLTILKGIQSLYNSGNTKDAERAFKAYTTAFGKGGVSQTQRTGTTVVYGPVQPTQGPIQRQDITKSLNSKMKEHSEDMWINWPWYFKEKVRNGGDWDLKNTTEYNAKVNHQGFVYEEKNVLPDAPGNIHYGYVGAAAKWSSHDLLLEKAGQAQIGAGTSESQWQNQYFHGDDPVDQIYILWGIDQYYNR